MIPSISMYPDNAYVHAAVKRRHEQAGNEASAAIVAAIPPDRWPLVLVWISKHRGRDVLAMSCRVVLDGLPFDGEGEFIQVEGSPDDMPARIVDGLRKWWVVAESAN